MAAGQVGGLLPHVAVPSTMPGFLIPEWGLSYAEAGLMASAYAIGYMLAAPVLTTLTDRIDARRILIVGSLLNAPVRSASAYSPKAWSRRSCSGA